MFSKAKLQNSAECVEYVSPGLFTSTSLAMDSRNFRYRRDDPAFFTCFVNDRKAHRFRHQILF